MALARPSLAAPGFLASPSAVGVEVGGVLVFVSLSVSGFVCRRFWVSSSGDSGFRLLVPGFVRAGSGFRLVLDSGFRLKKFRGSSPDLLGPSWVLEASSNDAIHVGMS